MEKPKPMVETNTIYIIVGVWYDNDENTSYETIEAITDSVEWKDKIVEYLDKFEHNYNEVKIETMMLNDAPISFKKREDFVKDMRKKVFINMQSRCP